MDSSVAIRCNAEGSRGMSWLWSSTGLMLALSVLSACGVADQGDEGATSDSEASESANENFPDVVSVEVELEEFLYSFSITISSPYDSPGQYANGWRILDPDGEVLAETYLAYHHADEQPFTLTQGDVSINSHFVEEVTIEARDSINGYGGGAQTVTLPTEW